MELLLAPLHRAEFLAVDTETNGRSGEECELTEVGAVLVGGGELHDRFESLVGVRAPLSRAMQRFTQINQSMLDEAPAAEVVLPEMIAQMRGRVLVAHNASFDRRVLRQACERCGLGWPDPPMVCTVALARRFAPLIGQRRLAALADALGIEVRTTHRALADAETCARIFCALLPRLCADAATVGDALTALSPLRRRRSRACGATDGGRDAARVRRATRAPDLSALPDEPGVYLFRNAAGQVLYVGKAVALRKRARVHFQGSADAAPWTAQAALADFVTTRSELGALLLEDRLIKSHAPPGNARGKAARDGYVYLRCRLDIAFPVLEVAKTPASGHSVSVGPLRGRAAAVELLEQINSLFGLRHCGRTLKRRSWASAYGQMGRCLSPCLGDLDPNLYHRRLDHALAIFGGSGDGRAALLAHVDEQMRAAMVQRQYERAATLGRRRARLEVLLERLGGVLAATHAQPMLVRAPHPRDPVRADLFWLVGGRIVDSTEPAGCDAVRDQNEDVVARTREALSRFRIPAGTTHASPGAIDEMRIVSTWLARNQGHSLAIDPWPGDQQLRRFVLDATNRPRGARSGAA